MINMKNIHYLIKKIIQVYLIHKDYQVLIIIEIQQMTILKKKE